jgi:L-aminopeptidase/D-esterase-like protein
MSATVVSGPRNLITDVAGLAVGNAHSEQFATGVTVLLPDAPCVAAVDIRGGAPGTRDIAALDPASLVQNVDAIVLSGGSVFGLEAAGGVTASLSAKGRGITFGKQPWPTPVVPAAILFDLMFGPDKQWKDVPPYRQLGLDALDAASADFALGNQGAGYGATTGTVKGGWAARPPCSRALPLAHSWPPTRSEPASTRAQATFGHGRLSSMGSLARHPRHRQTRRP